MSLSHSTAVKPALTLALALLVCAPVAAAPPPGMRWSDHAGFTSGSKRSTPRAVPLLAPPAPVPAPLAGARPTEPVVTAPPVVRPAPSVGPVVKPAPRPVFRLMRR